MVEFPTVLVKNLVEAAYSRRHVSVNADNSDSLTFQPRLSRRSGDVGKSRLYYEQAVYREQAQDHNERLRNQEIHTSSTSTMRVLLMT